MKKGNVIIVLAIVAFMFQFNFSFAQKQSNSKQLSPEKILQFLDRNKDQKISKQEAHIAKKIAGNFNKLDTNNDGFLKLEELKYSSSSSRYTYLESDGIYMYYETEEVELYRKLLPKEFNMPDRLFVYTFICDFYKMDAQTLPYKEASIFLLGKYNGKTIWHCIYMPVSSRESMLAGKYRLGLPKTMGNIDFMRADSVYNGSLTDENNCKFSLSINTNKHSFNKDEKNLLKELSSIPKMNLLNGEVIEMSGGRNTNIFDLAQKYPDRLIIKEGKGNVNFNTLAKNNSNIVSPLDLKPSKILGCYYMFNKIPFRLGKK